jgi:hypothetical protein
LHFELLVLLQLLKTTGQICRRNTYLTAALLRISKQHTAATLPPDIAYS